MPRSGCALLTPICTWLTDVFGNVACLSSTFSHRDDLIRRVRHEPLGARQKLKIYLDSGWPGDNYEATLTMAAALISRGFRFGRDFLHCAFPLGKHQEQDWGGRCHLPIQFFCGHPRRLSAAMRVARSRGLAELDGLASEARDRGHD